MSAPASSSAVADRHPLGIYILSSTEMWERFSYYGMRAMLLPYLLYQIQLRPEAANEVYKWYTSLVYITPLFGGFLADRYLGIRNSIVIGGVLMAIGHFLMAFEPLPFLFAALLCLILGNGFFKPNASTLVGKMYAPNDPRRDAAFTIFYMGINIGALAPFVCGWLRKSYGYHYGFAAAGVGMVAGLALFLAGQKRILRDVAAVGLQADKPEEGGKGKAVHLEANESEPGSSGFAGTITRILPIVLVVGVVAVNLWLWGKVLGGGGKWINLIMPTAFGAVGIWMAMTLPKVKGARRDQSSVIFVLFMFAVAFWMAFEQGGNSINLWGESHSRTVIGSWEFPFEWLQNLNSLFIIALGPVFSAFWVWSAKKGRPIPTPIKMFAALVLTVAAYLTMVASARSEDSTSTTVALAQVPPGPDLTKLNAGRCSHDAAKGELTCRGVLPTYIVTEALRPAVPKEYAASLDGLEEAATYASAKTPKTAKLGPLPEGYVFPLDGADAESVAKWDAVTGELTLTDALSPRQKNKLMGAGSPPEYRKALDEMSQKSNRARVTWLWLLLFNLLITVGELCLSPVGLSMVTKLAPARYASMFMGVWHLASSVAQYIGGSLAEGWGQVTPSDYFMVFVWVAAIGALALGALARPIRTMMHDVT